MTPLIWPFPTKDASQYRRIDQGWDLQVAPGTPLLAVAAGTLSYSNDPNGFGNHYPVLHLDALIDGNPAIYYGHNTSGILAGNHVNQGDVIGHAMEQPGGNAHNLPGWLEIGWWNGGPTGNGQSMHDHLINAPCYQEDDMFTDDDRKKLNDVWLSLEAKVSTDENNQEQDMHYAVATIVRLVKKITTKVGA